MASFKVVPKPSLEKDLRSLPKSIIVRVMKQIDELANDPLPRKAIKLEGGARRRLQGYLWSRPARKASHDSLRAPSTRRLPETLGARIYKC